MTTQPFIDPEREDLTSASAWERKHFCAGSDALIATLPAEARQSSGEAAASGTRIHKALETGDDSELEMGEGEVKERLSKLEQDAVSSWTESILDPNRTYSPRAIRETRMWVTDNANNKITSAKVDVAWVSFQHGIVLDYKSGYRPTTPAQRNLQAKVQAVALWQETGVSRIRVVIAQHRFSSMVTQADYTEEDLQRAYQEILYDDWRSKQPDAQRVPGKWCEYCPAKSDCVEHGVYSLLPSVQALNVPVPAQIREPISKAEVELYVQRLSIQDLAFIERRRTMATNLFEAAKRKLKTLTPEQLASVGYELTEGRNQLEVKDANGLCDFLVANDYLKEEEIISVFDLSNGKLEALVLPRIVEKNKLTQSQAKLELRRMIQERGYIIYDAPENRCEKSLKEKA